MSKLIKATLETRVSKKGNSFQVIVIKLTDTYEKLVFLEKAELELLNSNTNNDDIADNLDFPLI